MNKPILTLPKGKSIKPRRASACPTYKRLVEIREKRRKIEEDYCNHGNVKRWRSNLKKRFQSGSVIYSSHKMKKDIKTYIRLGKEEEEILLGQKD